MQLLSRSYYWNIAEILVIAWEIMTFNNLIAGIEDARGDKIPEHELVLIKKLWNMCVDCIADEWSVIGPQIRLMKVSKRSREQPTE